MGRLQHGFLPVYRLAAVLTLYGVLACVIGYAVTMGFYALNESWIAPVILSRTDDRSMELAQRIEQGTETLESTTLTRDHTLNMLNEMKEHRAALDRIKPELVEAIRRETEHNRATGARLVNLSARKHDDNTMMDTMLHEVSDAETSIRRELRAGLITRADAAIQLAQLRQTHNVHTDSEIQEVMMQDDILHNNTTDTRTLEILDKNAELESEIAQLDINIADANKQVETYDDQIHRLYDSISAARQAPYFLSTSVTPGGALQFAFVPYDNKDNAKVGASVYRCFIAMVGCHKVGSVAKIFVGEEHTMNPIFRTDMRGFFVQLELTEPQAAIDKTLFLDHKPFGI
jgi:hypothetical protein